MISGILLAAGESTRMDGGFKPLLKWGRRTVIGECINQMRNSQLADIFVVLGHRESEIRPALIGQGVQYAINEDYRKGMLTSVKTGLAMLTTNSDAFLVALVDQPGVSSKIIDSLIEAYAESSKGIIVPTFEGHRGHPVIIDSKYIDDILQLDDEAPGGLRAFIEARENDVQTVEVPSRAILEDIDTPGDYERLSSQVAPVYEHHKWHP
ncbi:MAG: NTP transferase domain-containing protein [Blastocatellales bacterium]